MYIYVCIYMYVYIYIYIHIYIYAYNLFHPTSLTSCHSPNFRLRKTKQFFCPLWKKGNIISSDEDEAFSRIKKLRRASRHDSTSRECFLFFSPT